jgi:two-component system OmpR family response regulator
MAKILVALTDERVARYVTDDLSGHGYEVHSATSIESVLDSLAEERFDAMVCDIFQPVIDGVALFATIARASPGTRVIALMDFQSTRARNYDIHIWTDSILTKPFTSKRVSDEVAFVLNGGRRIPEPASA